MSTTATFRWTFRGSSVARRVYAEAELEEVGRLGGRYYVAVYLVRDEMARRPAKGLIDPDRRVGMRVFVGGCRDEEACRSLAFLAPIEGARRACGLIYNVLLDHPEKVETFADDWLIETMAEARKRKSASEIGGTA